jgi:hypothetical protein
MSTPRVKYTIVFQQEVLEARLLTLRRVKADPGLSTQAVLDSAGIEAGFVFHGWPRQIGEEEAEEE